VRSPHGGSTRARLADGSVHHGCRHRSELPIRGICNPVSQDATERPVPLQIARTEAKRCVPERGRALSLRDGAQLLLVQDREDQESVAAAGRSDPIQFGWLRNSHRLLTGPTASLRAGSPAKGVGRPVPLGEEIRQHPKLEGTGREGTLERRRFPIAIPSCDSPCFRRLAWRAHNTLDADTFTPAIKQLPPVPSVAIPRR
jgi:hypothetical protein